MSGFTRIRSAGAMDLEITVQGGSESLTLEFSDKYQDKIDTRVENGTLIIETRDVNRSLFSLFRRNSSEQDVLRGVISVNNLEGLELSGAVNATLNDLDTESLELSMSGAADVSATGRAETLMIDGSGAVNVDAAGLRASSVNVEISGAGDVSVCAEEGLNASLSGAGTVSYYGEPAATEFETSGASDVEAKGACPLSQSVKALRLSLAPVLLGTERLRRLFHKVALQPLR